MNDSRQLFDGLFLTYMIVGSVVLVIVFGAVAFALVRYRDRDGHRTAPEPPHKPRLEFALAAVILLVVSFLLFRTFSTESKVDARPSTAERIEVTAFQWGWRFTYPDAGVSVRGDNLRHPKLVVPAGRDVAFVLRSRDVIHSFWIPQERFKRDAIPGKVNRFNLRFDRPGETTGTCAEFCGLDHADMRFDLSVREPAEFERWLRDAATAHLSGTGGAS